MSSAAGWLEAAGERYLRLRGSGLVLSSLDADRLRAWRDRGLPLDLVLRGLEMAHESWLGAGRANASRPFPLWAAERHVEELARGWERRTPGGSATGVVARTAGSKASASTTGSPLAAAVAKLERLLRHDDEGPASIAYRGALGALTEAVREGVEPSRALLRADETAGIAFVVALPRLERGNVVSEAMRRAGPRGAATRARHRAMLRAVLAEAAFRRGSLERPSDP